MGKRWVSAGEEPGLLDAFDLCAGSVALDLEEIGTEETLFNRDDGIIDIDNKLVVLDVLPDLPVLEAEDGVTFPSPEVTEDTGLDSLLFGTDLLHIPQDLFLCTESIITLRNDVGDYLFSFILYLTGNPVGEVGELLGSQFIQASLLELLWCHLGFEIPG